MSAAPNHDRLAGKVAVVTGAARGLGRAGADVAIVDIDLDAAREFREALDADGVPAEVERLGRRSLGIQADLTRSDEARRAIREAHQTLGRLDILVNNAGGALTPADRSRASESPEEDTRFLLDVNYMSAVRCCQAAAPILKAQQAGVIVNNSSQSAISTYQQGLLAAYSAAKAAMTQYTRYLAAELGPYGIRANCLVPGIMMTSRVAASVAARGVGTNEEAERVPLRRPGQVEDCRRTGIPRHRPFARCDRTGHFRLRRRRPDAELIGSAMNLDHVVNRRFEPTIQSYDARDSALYALSLGVGDDPLDEDELPYVYEGREPRAIPSQCVTLGWPRFWHDEPEAAISWRRILHGEQSFVLHRPLPLQGTICAQYRIVAVEDKGAGRGALIHFSTEISDARAREPLASVLASQFLRDDGGCGSYGVPPPPTSTFRPETAPMASCDYRTSKQAALLYRQASRDYMPIHADPDVARAAGFERPISHGLNTFGLACRAILKRCAPGAPERLRSMSARFVRPALPGDTIRVEIYRDGERVRFRALALERGVLVLDRGDCQV